MAVQNGPDDLRLLKDKVFLAATDNQPQVIQDCLASLHPDVVKDVLHHCSKFRGSLTTPLIVAAWNGHLAVVKLLVDEFKVNVDQTVSCRRDMSNALISAVCKGHLDIVKVLVRNGCHITTADSDGSTAIYMACLHDRLDVLKCLTQNGAQIDSYSLGSSPRCLIIACCNENREMVEFLLSKGADPNRQDCYGKTALHQAAEKGASDIITLLLQHGATFTKDKCGRSPLMDAAKNGFSNSVRVFLESVDLSQLERIEGLELLGATLARTNVNEAFMWVRQAMEERYKDPNNVLLKPHNPLPTLTNVQESQTLEELQARQSDQHLFRLECLAILSRILGPDDYVTFSKFRDYQEDLQSAGLHNEATALFLHGMKAAVKHSASERVIYYILRFLPLILVEILQNGGVASFSDLADIMEPFFVLMGKKKKMVFFNNLADDEIWLFFFLTALKVAQGQEEGRRLRRLTERFIRLSSGSTVLYAAGGLKWIRLHSFRDSDDLPYDLLFSLLLQCGVDVHVKDANKNTALHIIARLSQSGDYSDLVSRIARTLLDAGALVGVKNNNGMTPLDLAGPVLAAELREQYPVSLKSLAATVVVKDKIPYVGEVPEDLAEFIEKH